jgi:hypothetical protein
MVLLQGFQVDSCLTFLIETGYVLVDDLLKQVLEVLNECPVIEGIMS